MSNLWHLISLCGSYKQAYDEVSQLKKTLSTTSPPPEGSPAISTAEGSPDARVDKFKMMMTERRATALAAFAGAVQSALAAAAESTGAAESEEARVDRLKAMLSECRTSANAAATPASKPPAATPSPSPPPAAESVLLQQFPNASMAASKKRCWVGCGESTCGECVVAVTPSLPRQRYTTSCAERHRPRRSG